MLIAHCAYEDNVEFRNQNWSFLGIYNQVQWHLPVAMKLWNVAMNKDG